MIREWKDNMPWESQSNSQVGFAKTSDISQDEKQSVISIFCCPSPQSHFGLFVCEDWHESDWLVWMSVPFSMSIPQRRVLDIVYELFGWISWPMSCKLNCSLETETERCTKTQFILVTKMFSDPTRNCCCRWSHHSRPPPFHLVSFLLNYERIPHM